MTLPAPPPRPSRAGFTLSEMLVVLMLMGLLAVMAVPRLDVTSYRSDGAMHALGSTLMAVQRTAVMKQRQQVVAFDTANRRVRILDDANENGAVDTGERIRYEPLEPGMVFGCRGATAHAVGSCPITFHRLQNGMPSVTFLRNGAVSEEGGVYLTTLRASRAGNRPRDARLIVIERATGRPSWLSFATGQWKTEF